MLCETQGHESCKKNSHWLWIYKNGVLAEVKTVNDYDIPPELIINFDQANVNIVPVGDYTLEKSGSKQVQIIGLEDNRQVSHY